MTVSYLEDHMSFEELLEWGALYALEKEEDDARKKNAGREPGKKKKRRAKR